MSKRKKLAISLTRAFLGTLGIDNFIMKKIGSGIWAIITTIVLGILLCLFGLLCFVPGVEVIFIVCELIILICVFLRHALFFITGILLLCKTEKQINECY